MRLIDADKITYSWQIDLNGQEHDGITLQSIINKIPSVEAIPVIRCAECKWFQCNMRMDGYLPKGVDEFECRHWCGSCDPVDYCSYGERKES